MRYAIVDRAMDPDDPAQRGLSPVAFVNLIDPKQLMEIILILSLLPHYFFLL